MILQQIEAKFRDTKETPMTPSALPQPLASMTVTLENQSQPLPHHLTTDIHQPCRGLSGINIIVAAREIVKKVGEDVKWYMRSCMPRAYYRGTNT